MQTAETLPYFIYRLIRGAYIFENLAYLELRYTPYWRTPHDWDPARRIDGMAEVVDIVGSAMQVAEYPIVVSQILCLHSRLPDEANWQILELADKKREHVCGVDLAGSDSVYGDRLDVFARLFEEARSRGINVTCHLYETENGCYPELLPFPSRIGHGIQIPLHYPELLKDLARRGQCLEICPTTYFQTGTLQDFSQLKIIFDRCFEAGVDIAICTDNAGLHNVRLPFEYENLLTQDTINFQQLKRCQENAFRHAFAWPYPQPPATMLDRLVRPIQSPPLASIS